MIAVNCKSSSALNHKYVSNYRVANLSQDKKASGTQGGMTEHLERYRHYIDGLKSGKASGISAAFGRASDLLPPEALAIAPKVNSADNLGQTLFPREEDRQVLRQSLEMLIKAGVLEHQPQSEPGESAEQKTEAVLRCFSGDPIGVSVRTENGIEQVLSTYFESGELMYMLSDLSVIDEKTFLAHFIETAEASEAEAFEGKSTSENQESAKAAAAFELQEQHLQQDKPDLLVHDEAGQLLWQVSYDREGVQLVSMADGCLVKKAEGRQDYVFSMLSPEDGDIRFYILSGLVVDPNTGNVYLEANQGAYSTAYLNNGWKAHHYRTAAGEESYYLTEPMTVINQEGRMPETFAVAKLRLDMQTGSLFYSISGDRELELSCRKL